MYKYYLIPDGCMGYDPEKQKYRLFDTEQDYIEFIRSLED